MKTLLKILPGLALIGAAPAPGIAVGLVLNDTLGQTVRGWLHASGSMFTVAKTKNGITTLELECCVATFTRGRSFIVARTEPLARSANGGVIKERIIDLKRIDTRPGEVEMMCDLFELQAPFSVKNTKTNMVRSVIVSNGALALFEWKDTQNRCGLEGD